MIYMYDAVLVYYMACYLGLNSPGGGEGFVVQCLCALVDTPARPPIASVRSV